MSAVDIADQLVLFPIEPVPHREGMTLDERFEAFDRANPHVRQALVTLARQFLASGHTRVGMKMLWERLRWEVQIQTGERRHVLDNSLTSRFARKIAATCPDLADAFELRELRS